MKQTKFAKTLALCVGVLVFSVSASYLIFAWTAPGSTPPGGNVAAPINTGSTAQTKAGSLHSNNRISASSNIYSTGGSIYTSNGSIYTNNGSIYTNNGGLGSTANSSTGGYLSLTNSSKTTLGTAQRWTIYNMTGSYGDSLQFWAYDTAGCGGGLCTSRMTITDSGNVGIGTASPAAKLDVAGQIKISGGSPGAGKVLTSDSNGLATWKTPATGFTFSASSCPTGQWVIGMDADGKVVCSGSGNTPPWSTVSCAATSDELLTASARKRVFVTSSTYPINQTDSATKVDAICTNEARSAGLSGNYKALIYINNNNSRINLQAVLPINKRFMHCGIVSGKAEWWELANNPSAMLGRSLPYPIKYTATGTVAGGSGTSVFTNFQPIGGGSYVGYSPISSGLRKIVGDSTRKDVRWAYILLSCSTTACKNAPRSLYCIQQ